VDVVCAKHLTVSLLLRTISRLQAAKYDKNYRGLRGRGGSGEGGGNGDGGGGEGGRGLAANIKNSWDIEVRVGNK